MGLNSRIEIRQMVQLRDTAGQPIGSDWVLVGKAWADIRHPSGSESIRADRPTSTVLASMKVRQRADIAAGMRVLHGGRTYTIDAVLPDEQSRMHMFLVCKAST